MILNGSSCDQDHVEYTPRLCRMGLLSDAQLSHRITDSPKSS